MRSLSFPLVLLLAYQCRAKPSSWDIIVSGFQGEGEDAQVLVPGQEHVVLW